MRFDVNFYINNSEHLNEIKNVENIYHFDYWDGPISGLCLVNNKKYWYQLTEHYDDYNYVPDCDSEEYDDFEMPWSAKYILINLSEEQVNESEKRHVKFINMVKSENATPESRALFYKQQEKVEILKLENGQVEGYFVW